MPLDLALGIGRGARLYLCPEPNIAISCPQCKKPPGDPLDWVFDGDLYNTTLAPVTFTWPSSPNAPASLRQTANPATLATDPDELPIDFYSQPLEESILSLPLPAIDWGPRRKWTLSARIVADRQEYDQEMGPKEFTLQGRLADCANVICNLLEPGVCPKPRLVDKS